MSRSDYDFEGAWVARIMGSCKEYRFFRRFLKPVDKKGRFNRYAIAAAGDGIYEGCYMSGSKYQTRSYFRVEAGSLTGLTLRQVEELYPKGRDCIEVPFYFGPVGSLLLFELDVYEVIQIENKTTRQSSYDDDFNWSMSDVVITTTLLAPVSKTVAIRFLDIVDRVGSAYQDETENQICEIAESLSDPTGEGSDSYPVGAEYAIDKTYCQVNKALILQDQSVWILNYNGREGDDRSLNNVAGDWIGHKYLVADSVAEKLDALLRKFNAGFSDLMEAGSEDWRECVGDLGNLP